MRLSDFPNDNCPWCGEFEVDYKGPEWVSGAELENEAICYACGKEWTEFYRIVEVAVRDEDGKWVTVEMEPELTQIT